MDTFIEEQLKKFREKFPAKRQEIKTDAERKNREDREFVIVAEKKLIESFLLSALTEQKEALRKEIEKMKRRYDDAGSGTFLSMTAERGDGYYNQAIDNILSILEKS